MKKIILSLSFFITLFLINFSFAYALNTPIEDGVYKIESALKTNMFLDVKNASTQNETNVQLSNGVEAWQQLWNVKKIDNDCYEISTFLDSNKMLDVKGAKTANETNVQLFTKNGYNAQKWLIKDAGNGYYNIVSKLDNNKFLDVAGASTKNGTNIQIYQNNGNKAQKFKFIKQNVTKFEDGYYEIASIVDTTKLVGLKSEVSYDDLNVELSNKGDKNSQKWYLKSIGNGYYNIKSGTNLNKNLDVAGASKKNEANVQLFENNGHDAQKWYIKDIGNGNYCLIAKHSGLYLDIAGAKITDKTNIQTYSFLDLDSQKFKITKTDAPKNGKTIDDGVYRIQSALDSNMFLDIKDAHTIDGTNIQLYNKFKAWQQLWNVKYLNDGYYIITSYLNENKALSSKGNKADNFTNIELKNKQDIDSQKWILKDAGDGYFHIVSKIDNSKLVDVSEAKKVNGTNIQLFQSNGNKAQKFKFIKESPAKIENGYYQIKSTLTTDKVVGLNREFGNNEVNVWLEKGANLNSQKWYFESVGNGYYIIKSGLNNKKVLDVAGSNKKNESNVQIYEDLGLDAQKWYLEDTGNNSYRLIAKHSGLYLDIAGAKTNEQTNIQTYSLTGSKAQEFILEKTEISNDIWPLEDGIYSIKSALNDKISLDVKDSKTANETNVWLANGLKSWNQMWSVKRLENGYYLITSYLDDKMALDVAGASTKNGTNIQLFQTNGNKAQEWYLEDAGGGYYNIVSKLNDSKLLSIAGSSAINGANINLSDYNNSAAQKFKFVKENPIKIDDGYYQVESTPNNRVLDLANGANDESKAILNSNSLSNSQKWYFKHLGNGYYKIMSSLNMNKNLDVAGAGKINGTAVQIYENNGHDAQKWFLEKGENDNFHLVAKHSGLYLDISNTNLQTSSVSNSDSQNFKIIKTDNPKYDRSIEDGVYRIQSALKTNMYLDVKDAKTSDNNNIQLYKQFKSWQQLWNVKYLSDGYYIITSYLDDNKALSLENELSNNNANIKLLNKDQSNKQQWVIRDAGNGYYNIISKLDDFKLVDIEGASSKNNANIQLYEFNNNKSQKFKFVKENPVKVDDGYYVINSSLQSNKVVGLNKEVSANSVNVWLETNTNLNSQKWYFESVGNGYYIIKSGLNNKKVLDVAGASQKNESNVQIYENLGLDAQKWYLEDAGNNSYRLIAKHSGLYLDIAGAKTNEQTNIQTYANTNSKAQVFTLDKTELSRNVRTYDDGYYYFGSALDESKLIDVDGAKKSSGTNVQLYTKNGNNAQIWYVKYLNNGYYSLTSAMTPNIALTASGSNVQIAKYTGNDSQQWYFQDQGDGYVSLISKSTDLYVDVTGAKPNNFTNIQLHTGNNNKAQVFKINEHNSTKIYKGMDVSSWQKDIDWKKVADTGIDFVIIRAGYGGNWTNQDDMKLMRNVEGCEKYNIPYGLYLYSYATTVDNTDTSASAEANHMLRLLASLKQKNYVPSLGTKVFLDMEDKSTAFLDKKSLTAIANRFCGKMESNGYGCGIYANKTWLTEKLNASEIAQKYEIWLAQYPNGINTYEKAMKTKPSYNASSYTYWQFASDGRMNGVSGNVDLDLGYDIYDWKK